MPIPDNQSITRESRRRKRGMNLVLDIGSGLNPLKEENVIHVDINRLSKHLELVCDAYYLPFQNNKFQIVHASHILEHLENPIKVLEEWKRVTKHLIIIKVPNASFEGYIYMNQLKSICSVGLKEHLNIY